MLAAYSSFAGLTPVLRERIELPRRLGGREQLWKVRIDLHRTERCRQVLRGSVLGRELLLGLPQHQRRVHVLQPSERREQLVRSLSHQCNLRI